MTGISNNDEHPRIEAQAASSNYRSFASAAPVRRAAPVRKAPSADRRAASLAAEAHYTAVVSGAAIPADIRAAVGRY